MWDDYFRHPDALIVGIDVDIPAIKFPSRIRTIICNQNDSRGLNEMAEQYGPFDVVIDDGCHYRKETQNSFRILWPHVSAGGWYIIEDWAVGYWSDQPQYHGMVELVEELVQSAAVLGMSEARLILEIGKAMAIYRKNH